jgi:hypothetical protein
VAKVTRYVEEEEMIVGKRCETSEISFLVGPGCQKLDDFALYWVFPVGRHKNKYNSFLKTGLFRAPNLNILPLN